MKTILFCGGFGTRLREFSETIPKPLAPVGERPILWHLMRYYAHYGHEAFILCLGHRGQMIKEFFLSYNDALSSDFTLTGGGTRLQLHSEDIQRWRISFVDTGLTANIGQRLLRVRDWVVDDDMFLANYSDGLSDLPLDSYIERFRQSDAVACFIAVRPSHSLSAVNADAEGRVTDIDYLSSAIRINGGFFIFRREIFDYIREGEELVEEPFARLIAEKRLLCLRYDGFWQAMDTYKDKKRFDDLHACDQRPWEVWCHAPVRNARALSVVAGGVAP